MAKDPLSAKSAQSVDEKALWYNVLNRVGMKCFETWFKIGGASFPDDRIWPGKKWNPVREENCAIPAERVA